MQIPHQQIAAAYLFRELLVALEAGGFDAERDSHGLRLCMEHGWGFDRMLSSLASDGRPLTFEEDGDRSAAILAYYAAQKVLDPLYTQLVVALGEAGFEESWGAQSLIGALSHGMGFDAFKAFFKDHDRPLTFADPRDEKITQMLYQGAMHHAAPEMLASGMLASGMLASEMPATGMSASNGEAQATAR